MKKIFLGIFFYLMAAGVMLFVVNQVGWEAKTARLDEPGLMLVRLSIALWAIGTFILIFTDERYQKLAKHFLAYLRVTFFPKCRFIWHKGMNFCQYCGKKLS